MTIRRIPLSVVCFAAGLAVELAMPASGQEYSYTPSYAPAPPVAPSPNAQATATFTPDQLDQMLGPIALYPDPLLSEVLAASTYPQDVAAAGQFLQNNPQPSDADINSQNWDPSVKAIAHSPTVVEMMANDMDWTEALGSAFAAQQQDVMDSIQRLRAKAEATHALVTTPQQQVVADNGAIEILPAQPDVIYVPEYDPGIVYSDFGYVGPYITFGYPCPFGLFFDLDLDFRNHRFLLGRFDRGRFDFNGGASWSHDPGRPIPRPSRAFFPPVGAGGNRGWGQAGRPAGAFRPIQPPQVRAPAARAPERPVTGLPRATARPSPNVRPTVPVAPRALPRIPRSIPQPQFVNPRVERPVTGLPLRVSRPAEPQRVSPVPMQRAPAPSPVFRPSFGGGGSERGHSSMRR